MVATDVALDVHDPPAGTPVACKVSLTHIATEWLIEVTVGLIVR
jgi:hypothetical protein